MRTPLALLSLWFAAAGCSTPNFPRGAAAAAVYQETANKGLGQHDEKTRMTQRAADRFPAVINQWRKAFSERKALATPKMIGVVPPALPPGRTPLFSGWVAFLVTEDGRTAEIELMSESSSAALMAAFSQVRELIAGWRFQPATIEGQRAAYCEVVKIEFDGETITMAPLKGL